MQATRPIYAGLFLVTLSTLMFEILLTRIFSVTMWYHFAFVAISVAMFGMTAGALLVYLARNFFSAEQTQFHMSLSAWLFGVTMVAAFLLHLAIPLLTKGSNLAPLALSLTYTVISIPFVFSGICVCLALTRFTRQVGKLYAADLAGAATGCIVIIYALKVTDGPTAVIVCAFISCLGAASLGLSCERPLFMRVTRITSIALGVFVIVNTVLVHVQQPLIRLVWVRGEKEARPMYERWNSFSRIIVDGDPFVNEEPFGWGLSPRYAGGAKARQLSLRIDSGAETVLTGFEGDLAALDYLKYDITNLAHYVRPPARVLVVGAGGGRDVLSALAFHQPEVLGVEINENIITTLNGEFGRFTGHLDRQPGVEFINDEARSYVARQTGSFGIIQISLIDTWAATAAGAFVLAENALYTMEAWKIFLGHLTPDGVLSVTRWYRKGIPAETYRLVSLASAALAEAGAENPRDHMVLVRIMVAGRGGLAPSGLGTLLVSRRPYDATDLEKLQAVCEKLGFEIVLTPTFALDPMMASLASGKGRVEGPGDLNLAPPTDDSPFFFQMGRLWSLPRLTATGSESHDLIVRAVKLLVILLMTVTLLTVLTVVLPLALTARRVSWRGAPPYLVYFACIGMGFMLVEISQMQRLILFLGHPTYGLSVVLFTLLTAGGLGSFLVDSALSQSSAKPALLRLGGLLIMLAVFGFLTPHAIRFFQSSTTPLRIIVSLAILFPLGVFMGMAFPLGMGAASARAAALTPWLWGINGACSVLASVLAVVIALGSGISAAFWTGVACYTIALMTYAWSHRATPNAQPRME